MSEDVDYSGLVAFGKNVQPFDFERGGKTVVLHIDIDAFTSNYFRAVRTRMTAKFAKLVEEDKEARETLVDTVLQEEQARFASSQANSSTALVPAGQDGAIEGEVVLQAPTREDIIKKLDFPPLLDPVAATMPLEFEAKSIDETKEINIELLRGDLDENPETGTAVLVDWDLPDLKIPCNKKALSFLSPRHVSDLWEFCAEKAKTVKKTPDS